jgi:O-antigen/teichoic acid export membrane protein
VASSCHAHAIIGRSDGGEPAELDRRRVLTFGAAAVVAGALQQAGTHAPVFLLGTLTSHEQAGYFAVISRLTTLITVVTAGLATFVCPAIVIAWRDQDWSGLLSLVRASAWLSLGSASIGALALILAGDWVLIIFGPEFRAAYPGLVVLSVCVALSMATGVAASLLAMTDNEREVPIGVAVGLAVQLPLAFWLIPRLGLVGAAAAAGLGLVSCNAYWAWQVRRKLGIDCTVAAIRHDLSATKGSHRTGFGAAPLKDENPTYIEAEVRRIGGSE